MEWSIKAGLQSANVNYPGERIVEFKNGQKVRYTYPMDKIYGLFVGTFGHQACDKQYFYDDANDLEATLQFGAYMFKKQDYVWGEIKH